MKTTLRTRWQAALFALILCAVSVFSTACASGNPSSVTTAVTTTTTVAATTDTAVTTTASPAVSLTTKPQSATPTLSAIPPYTGRPYVTLNNNIPVFSASELTTTAYERYAALDSLGRCGAALASCGKEIMPADGEKRGSISSIKPSGWVQATYDCVNGKYLYNRSHLIGWQLSAENANKRNLITGTRYMNTEGMLPFENMVADYIRETGNHVAYRVTPIYEGDNLLPSGVQMEAYSVEDDGEGICFHVYVYNVQPGIVIDYATGASRLGTDMVAATTTTAIRKITTTKATTTTAVTEMVWVPQSGKKYHSNAACSGMKDPTQLSVSEAVRQGYEPCKRCYH